MCSSESAKPGKCARAGGDSGAGALGQGTDKSREILCLTKKAVCPDAPAPLSPPAACPRTPSPTQKRADRMIDSSFENKK